MASLDNYGGLTEVMPLLPGSPAIEGGLLLAGAPASDPLGNPRPNGALPDIGAVEAFPFSKLTLVDTDGDHIDDRIEPAYPQLTVGVDDSALDSGNDGDTDAKELASMTDPLDTGDWFRIIDITPATGFDLVSNPVFDVTWRSFPGLKYSFEFAPALNFNSTIVMDVPTITATEHDQTATLLLQSGRDFVRVLRK